MKILKSFELLNSEGPVLKIEKRENHWSFSFHGTDISVITNTTEILSFVLGHSTIQHPGTGKVWSWTNVPDSMKVESEIKNAILFLLREEIDLIKGSPAHFEKFYLKLWK